MGGVESGSGEEGVVVGEVVWEYDGMKRKTSKKGLLKQKIRRGQKTQKA